jgi:hypothetical protein
MTDRVKTLDEPLLLSEIRALPRRYLRPDGRLDSARMRLDLGILSDGDLKDALLALYRLDLGVAHRVNERLARALVARLVGASVPVTLVPPEEESVWLRAEMACDECPGSQTAPVFGGGPELPLCLSRSRLERWESCMQFRERLAQPVDRTPAEPAVDLAPDVDAFERSVDEAAKALRGV